MPDLLDNNPIDANGTYHFRVNQAGRYRVAIGARMTRSADSAGEFVGQSFGNGNVTIQQDGIAYTGMDGATAAVVKELVLKEGPLKVVVAGATSPSIGISIQPINSPG